MDVCRLWIGALAAVLLIPSALAQDNPVEAEHELNEVRRQIESLQEKVRDANKRRGSAQNSLREAELAESGARKRLAAISKELAVTRKRLDELQQEVARKRAELESHSEELAQQLRLAYMTGREEWLRTILNQQDPVGISRQLVYYSYIARQRTELMDVVRIKLQSLRAARAAAADEQDRLQRLEEDQQSRLEDLSAARGERAIVLARIDEDIAKRSGRLEVLQKEAEGLEELVAELTRLLSNLAVGDSVAFAERKGKMSWPAKGRTSQSFGQARAGGNLSWKGVLLSADAGVEVRAVHHGRVVFADWLPGMGLLVVLEHGDGFMSLYGHNQDLLVDVGEWVSPESVIAHVGDSGGRADTGLYFEIRKDGKPVDPGDWVQ